MNTTVMSGSTIGNATRDSSLWRPGLHAGVVSSIVNSAIYVGAALAGVFPHIIKLDPTEPGLTVLAVVLVSMVGSLAAMGAWSLVERFTARPLKPYLWLAGGVLVLSFAAPYLVPGTTGMQAIVQNLLHVVVAASVVWEVRKLARR